MVAFIRLLILILPLLPLMASLLGRSGTELGVHTPHD
jgi:hypothetical protein